MKTHIAAADPRIKQFCDLVNAGVESWSNAGQLLCEIRADNPNAYAKIIAANPWLTRDVLETFERIGRKQIYPFLLVDGSYGATRLASFTYEKQHELYHGTVRVAVKNADRKTISIVPKRVSDLTAGEAARVFDGDRVRSPDEQRAILRSKPKRIPSPASAVEKPRIFLNGAGAEVEFRQFLESAAESIEKARQLLKALKNPELERAIENISKEIALALNGKARGPYSEFLGAGSIKLTPAAEALIAGRGMTSR